MIKIAICDNDIKMAQDLEIMIQWMPFNNVETKIFLSGYLVTLVIALLQSFNVNLRYIGINYYITLGGMHLVFLLLILLLGMFSKEAPISLPNKLLLVVLSIPISSLLVLVFL